MKTVSENGGKRCQAALIDGWTPPTGVTLTQIAGWGIPTTISGTTLEIYTAPNFNDPSLNVATTTTMLTSKLNFTVDGSGTVVTPSALATAGSERYWVNLENGVRHR